MVNETKCQCQFFYFDVSPIYVSSENNSMPFFNVNIICHECGKMEMIAMHTMQVGNHIQFFREHHEMTQDYYRVLSQ